MLRPKKEAEVTKSDIKIPAAPVVPTNIFAKVAADSPAPGTYESREKVLVSLMQKVPRIDSEISSKKTGGA